MPSLQCIHGHDQHGNGERALEIFEEMKMQGTAIDCVTVTSLLSACSSSGNLVKGKQLHSFLWKVGMSSDYMVEGSLLDMYVKCLDIGSAGELFQTADKMNVVTWNIMLVAYGQDGDLAKSFDLFHQMHAESIYPNQFTYPSLLRTCACCGALELGRLIHCLSIKMGFESDVYVSGVLVDMYSKLGQFNEAKAILQWTVEGDVVSWTSIVAGYTQHGLFCEALRSFKEMLVHDIWPDNIGMASALSACAGTKGIRLGLQLHAKLCVSGYMTDTSTENALVHLYARCGQTRDAYTVFENVKNKDVISWNCLISGLAQSGYCEEALKVFTRMNSAGFECNMFTFGSVVSASSNLADIKQGRQIHAKIIKSGYNSETEVGNAVISLYGKCGSIEDANREFTSMPCRNEISWNAMITGYSQNGYGLHALDMFDRMKQEGLRPNDVTLIGVLAACSHVGLVDDGIKYFESMVDNHDNIARPDHYACVVDILGRAGKLEQAKRFVMQMPIEPDAMVWRTLLGACTVHKNVDIGEIAAKHLLELEPHDSASYALVSNMYAVSRRWDERDSVRKVMKVRGVKKVPGRSWIEVNSQIHAFFVGDKLHPLILEINNYLNNLNDRVAELGYKQERYRLLRENEQEHKDPSTLIHSEKLAVAFGLMKLPSLAPIRVMKNLRICNDCHTWMKFISQVTRRKIILRDMYRFHHFENGKCSCGDYW